MAWLNVYQRADGDWCHPPTYEEDGEETYFRAHIGFTPVKVNSDLTVTCTTSHDLQVGGTDAYFYGDSFHIEYALDYASPWNNVFDISGVWDQPYYGTWENEITVPVGRTIESTAVITHKDSNYKSYIADYNGHSPFRWKVPSPKRPVRPKIEFDETTSKFTISTEGFESWEKDGTSLGDETPVFYRVKFWYNADGATTGTYKYINLTQNTSNQKKSFSINFTSKILYNASIECKWHGVTVESELSRSTAYSYTKPSTPVSSKDAYVKGTSYTASDCYVKVGSSYKECDVYVKVGNEYKKASAS